MNVKSLRAPIAAFAVCMTAFSAQAADKPAFNTKYIPKDVLAATVFRPALLLDSRTIKETRAAAEKLLGKELANRPLRELEKEIGTPPSNIDEVLILSDLMMVRYVTYELFGLRYTRGKNANGLPVIESRQPMVIVRFRKPVNQLRILTKIFRGLTSPGVKRVHAGKTYYVLYRTAVCMVDAQTLLVGTEANIKQMISANDATSPIAKLLLKSKPTDHGIFAMTETAVTDVTRLIPRGNLPVPLAKLADHSAKFKTILATGRLTGKSLATLQIETADPASAARTAATVKDMVLPMVTGIYKQALRPVLIESKNAAIAGVVDELLDKVRIESNDAAFAVRFARPVKLDALPKQLGPLLLQVKQAALRTDRKNRFKQIGIALHNFHEEHLRFPRHGSDGFGKSTGLSWRVHILPFMDQKNLYDQFKLNEPWDSPHNKKLIAKMPDVFRHRDVKAVGKTRAHVFVGVGTPFDGQKPGSRFRDIVDGTSSTIAVVEAGADKAEFWTKPGGIIFDPEENPFNELGKVGDGFIILLMDGSARFVHRKLDPETFRRLIQHSDGEVVPEF